MTNDSGIPRARHGFFRLPHISRGYHFPCVSQRSLSVAGSLKLVADVLRSLLVLLPSPRIIATAAIAIKATTTAAPTALLPRRLLLELRSIMILSSCGRDRVGDSVRLRRTYSSLGHESTSKRQSASFVLGPKALYMKRIAAITLFIPWGLAVVPHPVYVASAPRASTSTATLSRGIAHTRIKVMEGLYPD